MELSEAKQKYIFTTRIEFDDDFIVLREPSQEEIVNLKKEKEDDVGLVDSMEKLFSGCLVDHSFTKAGKKASNNEVYEVLKPSATLFSDILTEWMDSLPFQSRIKRKEK